MLSLIHRIDPSVPMTCPTVFRMAEPIGVCREQSSHYVSPNASSGANVWDFKSNPRLENRVSRVSGKTA